MASGTIPAVWLVVIRRVFYLRRFHAAWHFDVGSGYSCGHRGRRIVVAILDAGSAGTAADGHCAIRFSPVGLAGAALAPCVAWRRRLRLGLSVWRLSDCSACDRSRDADYFTVLVPGAAVTGTGAAIAVGVLWLDGFADNRSGVQLGQSASAAGAVRAGAE